MDVDLKKVKKEAWKNKKKAYLFSSSNDDSQGNENVLLEPKRKKPHCPEEEPETLKRNKDVVVDKRLEMHIDGENSLANSILGSSSNDIGSHSSLSLGVSLHHENKPLKLEDEIKVLVNRLAPQWLHFR
ncbi:hypothetical protein MKW98_014828 [Papaver atlanticum]|uniref:Uncharacterized protein n=1 Tax=Papaver atlanticum TaxID=357466 RepID=A0AAD4SI67_9MAGN|nr:hypothetical protein MKW98_014828 [Papaver atlanticum]